MFGCSLFLMLGLGWAAFVSFDLFVHTFGDCSDNPLCEPLRRANGGLVLWRGFAIGLIICLAYAAYRRFFEDENVF